MSESEERFASEGGRQATVHIEVVNDDEKSRKRERHARFVECLERRGTNLTGNDWLHMAEDLGWPVEEVEIHAYQYMHALMEVDQATTSERPSRGIHNQGEFVKVMSNTLSINDNAIFGLPKSKSIHRA